MTNSSDGQANSVQLSLHSVWIQNDGRTSTKALRRLFDAHHKTVLIWRYAVFELWRLHHNIITFIPKQALWWKASERISLRGLYQSCNVNKVNKWKHSSQTPAVIVGRVEIINNRMKDSDVPDQLSPWHPDIRFNILPDYSHKCNQSDTLQLTSNMQYPNLTSTEGEVMISASLAISTSHNHNHHNHKT